MDTVINKISEIESAATSIMDDTNTRKKQYAKEMEDKTAAFDAGIEAETAKQIDDLRSNMVVDMEAKLSNQTSDAAEILKQMEDIYHKNHEVYVQELFQMMIKEL